MGRANMRSAQNAMNSSKYNSGVQAGDQKRTKRYISVGRFVTSVEQAVTQLIDIRCHGANLNRYTQTGAKRFRRG